LITGIRPIIGLALALLAGCAPVKTQSEPQTQLLPQANAPSETEYIPGELNPESLLELLTAELAGQRRDFDTAFSLYLRQAELNNSPELVQRATRIAQFNRDPEAIITAAKLWRKIEPQSNEPNQILITVFLHESRFNEALALIETQETLSAEILLLLESKLDTFDPSSAKSLAALLEQRLDKSPEQLDLLLVLARTYSLLQDETRALELLDQGLTVEPQQPDLVVEKAQLLRRSTNDSTAALNLVESALANNRDHRQLHAVYVQLLLELKPESVQNAVDKAINDADRDPQLIYYYALLLLENEQPTQSLALLRELLARDPARTDLYLYTGVNYTALGQREDALSAFAKVEAGELILNSVSRGLELLDIETEYDRALVLVEQARERDPERASQLAVLFGRWMSDNDKLELALDYLADQISADPNDISLLYTRALLIEPLDSQQMLEDLERAFALDPDNPGTQNALGYSLLEHTDEYQRAYDLIEQAIAQNPDDPAYLDSMGWALFKLERLQEALPYLEQAFEQMPDPEVSSHLIIVLIELGELERAEQLLTDQESMHPDNEDLREARRWLER